MLLLLLSGCTSLTEPSPAPAAISPTSLPTSAVSTPTSLPTAAPTPAVTPPAFEPRWLALLAIKEEFPILYALKTDGSGLTTLVDSLANIGSPSWSPDGKQMLFHASAPPSGLWDIFTLDLPSLTLLNLTEHPAEDFYPLWSPDGSRIAFVSNRGSYASDIFLMQPDGSQVAQVTNNKTWQRLFGWSPDGARLIFYMNPRESSGGAGLYSIGADGSGQTLLAADPALAWATFSADGSAVWYESLHDGLLYQVPAQGGEPQAVERPVTTGFGWSFSPERSQAAFYRRDDQGQVQIYLGLPWLEQSQPVPNSEGGTEHLAWGPLASAAPASGFGPTVTPPARLQPGVLEAGDEAAARQALLDFFEHLNQRQYDQAVDLYGGPYANLIDANPTLHPRDRAGLLRNGCEINGYECSLTVRSAEPQDQTATDEITFQVEFSLPDGSLYTPPGCCGGTAPGITSFSYPVRKTAPGRFQVLALPPYSP